MVLSEKVIMKKYGYSDEEMVQERIDFDRNPSLLGINAKFTERTISNFTGSQNDCIKV